MERAVRIKRALICRLFFLLLFVGFQNGDYLSFTARASHTQTLECSDIPLTNYDYSHVLGACYENVVRYIPLPLGIAGPLTIDGELCPIPMATAEGTLVASTFRGCRLLELPRF